MKITHPSGQNYDLFPDTDIEITRYNPFFHALGEQSIPIQLPPTGKNRALLGYPDQPDNVDKAASRLDVNIQSGIFSVTGRQAILSAQRGGSIETSFYFNEGAFYEKMSNLTLAEIFADKKISFSSVDSAITFLYSLVSSVDSRFAVFPIATEKHRLNALSDQTRPDGLRKFINEVDTQETINDKTVTIPKGFFLTPFVKVRHVLEEVLAYMGYSLGSSFLSDAPFNEMVFLNNNIDTIADNSINYVDLVPNISVKVLFDVLRKFNVEFVPDEQMKIVNIVGFNSSMNHAPVADLSKYAISEKKVSYHGNYRQVRLSSEMINPPSGKQYLPVVDFFPSMELLRTDPGDTGSNNQGLHLFEIITQYPTVYFRELDGALVRDGFQGDRAFIEKITGAGLGYYAGGPLEVEDFTFPDVIPDMQTEVKITYSPTVYHYTTFPFVGPERALRSKILFDDQSETENSASELKAMLCLFYRTPSHCVGVLNNYDNNENRLWNNSLLWNGADGIFEKFWRQRDTILRNALLPVEVDVILPEELKISIPSVYPLLLHGQKYLLSELQYTTRSRISGKCSLLSTKLQAPVSSARPFSEYFRPKTYRWELKYSQTWPGAYRFVSQPTAFYPPDPTPEQYAAGGKYYGRTYNVEFAVGGTFDNPHAGTIYVWLEPALV